MDLSLFSSPLFLASDLPIFTRSTSEDDAWHAPGCAPGQQLARIKKMHRYGAFSRLFPVPGFDARRVPAP
jgi:hypothetical protein